MNLERLLLLDVVCRRLTLDNDEVLSLFPVLAGSMMRLLRDSFFLLFIGTLLISSPGCGGRSEPTVAPRTDEEIQAYKDEVYGAEEEDSAAADED